MADPWTAPAALRKGDLVRIVAPSGSFDRPKFAEGVELLESAGLRVAYDESIFARHLYFAGDDAQRCRDMERALGDPEARAIWCAKGGYGAARILPCVGREAVRRAQKWLIGFSDVTALHCAWSHAGVVSLHGANVHTLSTWGPAAREALLASLMAHQGMQLQGETVTGAGMVRGRLLGGNLTVLASLAGTGFLPSWEDAIVFLEDVGEQPYRLDRCVTQLRLAGAFKGVRGIAVGQLTDCRTNSAVAPQVDALAAIVAALEPLGLPIIAHLAVGHEATSQPLLLGIMAALDLSRGVLTADPTSS